MPVSCSRQALSLYGQGVLSYLALNKGYHIKKISRCQAIFKNFVK